MSDTKIEFERDGIKYAGDVIWSAGAAGAGFRIKIAEPFACVSGFINYYSTGDGIRIKQDLRKLYEIAVIETIRDLNSQKHE